MMLKIYVPELKFNPENNCFHQLPTFHHKIMTRTSNSKDKTALDINLSREGTSNTNIYLQDELVSYMLYDTGTYICYVVFYTYGIHPPPDIYASIVAKYSAGQSK